MKTLKGLWTATAFVILVAFGMAAGVATAATATDPGNKLTTQDRSFARTAIEGGKAQVQIVQIAQQRTFSPVVKHYADRLLEHHLKANKQLKQIAQKSEELNVPNELPKKKEETLDELAQLSGAEFDQRFLEVQMQEIAQDIDMFTKEARTGSDPQIKQFAKQAVPVLKDHLNMARKIAKRRS